MPNLEHNRTKKTNNKFVRISPHIVCCFGCRFNQLIALPDRTASNPRKLTCLLLLSPRFETIDFSCNPTFEWRVRGFNRFVSTQAFEGLERA